MKIVGKTAAEIFDCIRLMTRSKALQPGDALPPVRDLAVALEVNRNTVAAAYKRLVAAGIAVSQGRLGTLIRQTENMVEREGGVQGSPLTDVASGNPNPQWLPDVAAALVQRPYRPRLYGEPTVNAELEAYGRRWMEPDCPSAGEINLTHGAVDAVERLLAAELVGGDKVVVESPCFLSSIITLRVVGLVPVGVAVDSEGMCPAGLAAALEAGAQAVVLTPRAHNPTGCSLRAGRAAQLQALLAQYPHVLIIVDDHFALLSSQPYHSIIPASAERWALIRSVSKVLGPDMRLALVCSDAQTSRRLRLRLVSGTNWVSHLLQDVVLASLTSPLFEAQISRAKADYAQRQQWLRQALQQHGLQVPASCDGLNLWLPLQQEAQPLAHALARRGWLVRNSEPFCLDEAVAGLRLTIATLDEPQAQKLAEDIRACLTGC